MKRVILFIVITLIIIGCKKPKPVSNNNRTVYVGDTFSLKVQECVLLKLDTIRNVGCVVCLDSIYDNRCKMLSPVDECWQIDTVKERAFVYLRVSCKDTIFTITPSLLGWSGYACCFQLCDGHYPDTLTINNKKWRVLCCRVYPENKPSPKTIATQGEYFAIIKIDEL